MRWFWREQGELVNGDRAARESFAGSFLDSVKHEIQLYTRLLLGQTSNSSRPFRADAAPSDTVSVDEHDKLLHRLGSVSKSPRILPLPWYPPDEVPEHEELMQLLERTDTTTRVAGDLCINDLRCLLPLEWLNDEVMNSYVELINSACSKLQLPVHCWNTFFWPTLAGGDSGEYDYNKVRRWTKRKRIDIFALDLMFIPLHVNHVHWSLGLVDFKSKLIFFFDSLGYHAPDSYLRTVRRYLCDEWLDKKAPDSPEAVFDAADYLYAGNNFALSQYSAPNCDIEACLNSATGDVRESAVPTQQNGSDCGVFTCLFMRELAFNRFPFHFSDDMSIVRQLMLRDILRGELELPR